MSGLKSAKIDDVRDTLIIEYCDVICNEYMEDYNCPNHDCIVWKLLNICADENLKRVK